MNRIRMLGGTLLVIGALSLRTAAAAPAAPPAPKPAATPKPPAAAPAKANEPLASFDEIKKSYDAGEYPKTLAEIARVLARPRAEVKDKYDRYELLALKGEAHLRLKQLASAGDAFGAAAKETDDPVKAATARATQRLMREQKSGKVERRHLRKGEKPQPESADVTDPDQRADALKVVYEDMRVSAEPKVKSALRARELTEIDAAFKQVAAMHDFELAVTGDDDEQVATQRQLGERARELIRKELNEMSADVKEMHALANEITQVRATRSTTSGVGINGGSGVGFGNGAGGRPSGSGAYGGVTEYVEVRRGLTNKDRRDLDGIVRTCGKVVPAADGLADMLGNPEDAKALARDAKSIGDSASRLLLDFPPETLRRGERARVDR